MGVDAAAAAATAAAKSLQSCLTPCDPTDKDLYKGLQVVPLSSESLYLWLLHLHSSKLPSSRVSSWAVRELGCAV